jgi:hypothetical protein
MEGWGEGDEKHRTLYYLILAVFLDLIFGSKCIFQRRSIAPASQGRGGTRAGRARLFARRGAWRMLVAFRGQELGIICDDQSMRTYAFELY